MLLLRALNDYDLIENPLENGIASKQMIFDSVRKYYENNREYINLNEEDKNSFIQDHIEEYLKSHYGKLEKLFTKRSEKTREDVKEYREFMEAIKGKNIEKTAVLM